MPCPSFTCPFHCLNSATILPPIEISKPPQEEWHRASFVAMKELSLEEDSWRALFPLLAGSRKYEPAWVPVKDPTWSRYGGRDWMMRGDQARWGSKEEGAEEDIQFRPRLALENSGERSSHKERSFQAEVMSERNRSTLESESAGFSPTSVSH